MFLKIHYPPKDFYVTALVLENGKVYWKAADIVNKILNYQNVGDTVRRHLPSDKYYRYSDFVLQNHLPLKYRNIQTMALSYDQVMRFMNKVLRDDETFYKWFIDVNTGEINLYTVSHALFQLNFQKKPEFQFDVYLKTTGDEDDYKFTLPDFCYNIKQQRQPVDNNTTATDWDWTKNINGPYIPPSIASVSRNITSTASSDSKKTKFNHVFSNDEKFIDKSKCFDYTDTTSNETYTYLAIDLNWPERIPVNVLPHLKLDDDGRMFLYVPIRK